MSRPSSPSGSSRSLRNWVPALFACLGLAAALAVLDVLLHRGLDRILADLAADARSLSWLTLAYAVPVMAVSVVARSWAWTAAVVLGGTALLQGGFLLYRFPLSTTARTIAALLAVAVVSVALAVIIHRGAVRFTLAWRAAMGLGIAAAAGISGALIPPAPPRVVPASWPVGCTRTNGSDDESASLLLVTLDTVRADHLGPWGYRGISTPRLDELAREGVVFKRAQAQAPFTPASHASILTGLHPSRHGVRSFATSQTLAPVPVLAEILREAGWCTGAMIAVTEALHTRFGLHRGFDVYHVQPPAARYVFETVHRALLPRLLSRVGLVQDRSLKRQAGEMTDDALRWLEVHGAHRFFLWVHYFDAHDPYLPEREDTSRGRHPGASWLDRFGSVYGYDSELIGLDREMGRLIDAVRARGVLDRTVVAVVSDHGEGLGDHSYLGHTLRLFQEQLHIPLLFRYPARLPPGTEIDAQVRSVDIAPTLLELLGLAVPSGLDGATLLPLLESTDPRSDRISIAETLIPEDPDSQLVAVSDGHFKLIRSMSDDRRWLYDLWSDPREERDVEADHPDVARRLAVLLDESLATAATDQEPSPGPELDEAQRRRLEALGYLE